MGMSKRRGIGVEAAKPLVFWSQRRSCDGFLLFVPHSNHPVVVIKEGSEAPKGAVSRAARASISTGAAQRRHGHDEILHIEIAGQASGCMGMSHWPGAKSTGIVLLVERIWGRLVVALSHPTFHIARWHLGSIGAHRRGNSRIRRQEPSSRDSPRK